MRESGLRLRPCAPPPLPTLPSLFSIRCSLRSPRSWPRSSCPSSPSRVRCVCAVRPRPARAGGRAGWRREADRGEGAAPRGSLGARNEVSLCFALLAREGQRRPFATLPPKPLGPSPVCSRTPCEAQEGVEKDWIHGQRGQRPRTDPRASHRAPPPSIRRRALSRGGQPRPRGAGADHRHAV